ncbi:MAG: hypothetical protein KF753_18995 [Caldilineaceae bacterium]|nr:hypothetical protein [Caldilineaceae bacterium]
MTDDNPFHLFNTKTMSGIHPGSRTAQANVVRWQGQGEMGWARILWPGESGDADVFLTEGDRGWQAQPTLHLSGTNGEKPVVELLAALVESGRQPLACGSCGWWQPLEDSVNPDGIPLGQCGWTDDKAAFPSAGNYEQSALAMACPHWQADKQTPAAPIEESVSGENLSHESGLAETVGWWGGLKARFLGKTAEERPQPATDSLAERSGVGAGTEQCLACHGRIANLGALTIATDSDDKRTLSVWRCRLCHTFYLNDWIDRWERLDTLETEESYYRIAPHEALGLLALFRQTSGGEHPKERHSRGAQRAQMDAFLAGRPRLLHQIKQGR